MFSTSAATSRAAPGETSHRQFPAEPAAIAPRAPRGAMAWIVGPVVAVSIAGAGPVQALAAGLAPGWIVCGAGALSGNAAVLGAVTTGIAGNTASGYQVFGGLPAVAVGATVMRITSAPTLQPPGQAAAIAMAFQSPFGAPEATLSYRAGGATTYVPLTMIRSGGA